MAYNPQMETDKTLEEFVQILERIKEMIGDVAIEDDEGFDLTKAVERLRLSGNNDDADELAELIERADELKAQHQAKS
jgi:hypothetical protein